MMDYVTSFSRSGIRDWLFQRLSAVVLGVYGVVLLLFFLTHPQLQYDQWHGLFASTFMRIFSFLALLSIVVHSWIGIWIVFTDYIKMWCVRLILQILVILLLLSLLAWGIEILWGL